MFNRQAFSFRNTIFVRMIITFLLIMLPVITFGVFLYRWIIQTTSEDISKTAVSQIKFYLTDFENEIERLKMLQYSLLEDEDLNEITFTWRTMNNIERMDKINILSNRLYTMQNSSMYIKDVTVHILPILKSISSVNGPGQFDTEQYNGIRPVFGAGSQIIEWRDGLYLSALKMNTGEGNQPPLIIDIELDIQKLGEALHQFNTYTGSGTLLISGNTGFVLASGSTEYMMNDAVTLARETSQASIGTSQTYELLGNRYYMANASSKILNMSIYRFIPEQIIHRPLNKFYTWAWLLAAATFLIIALYAISTYKLIHQPLLLLVKSFRRLESGDLNLAIRHEVRDEFGYLYGRFNQMVDTLRTLIDQVYKQKIMAQRAELKQLQSQINPHFLFNSFFILSTMAKTGDLERIELFTRQLGEYFQFVTRNASDEVPLKNEIHHASLYAEIQKLRFSRRVQVQFEDLPKAVEQLKVPRLIVQPIIENAFEHSIEHMASGGLIAVRFDLIETEVRIVVEDNGNRLTNEALKHIADSLAKNDEQMEITGMMNIHRRLKITFGDRYGLEVSRGALGGLRVIIRFPVQRGERYV